MPHESFKARLSLRGLFERWLHDRLPRTSGPIKLTRRRVFILPTRFGYGYVILLVVMLLGAINYGNSMAFALTFLLAGIGLTAMYHTHANIVNLVVSARPPMDVFAGQDINFAIKLLNPTRRARCAIRCGWRRTTIGNDSDIQRGDSQAHPLSVNAANRGWLELPRFVLASEFPLGLFRAWSWVDIDSRALVYPRPAGTSPFPEASGNAAADTHHHIEGNDSFEGLRDYHPGDPLRRMHWKSLARGIKPQFKQFSDLQDGNQLWLDWQATRGRDTEARLSQLTRWLLDAEQQGRAYGLHLPGTTLEPRRGMKHRNDCLRALALYGLDRAA